MTPKGWGGRTRPWWRTGAVSSAGDLARCAVVCGVAPVDCGPGPPCGVPHAPDVVARAVTSDKGFWVALGHPAPG